jgi:hypothetical protein
MRARGRGGLNFSGPGGSLRRGLRLADPLRMG